jgi:hypothetical protein
MDPLLHCSMIYQGSGSRILAQLFSMEKNLQTLASWVKKGYVAGPFPASPVPNFRSNAMLAIEQKGKIRIVMDLSSPKGASFNDAGWRP